MWKRWKPLEEFDRLFEEFGNLNFEGRPEEAKYFGYSAYVGPDGIPHVKTFGNVEALEPVGPERLEPPEPGDARKPYADVLVDEKRGELIVTAEMPGIEKKDVKLNATEREIEISAETKDRKYHNKVPLETDIEPENTSATYNNGILEIKAPLKGPGKSQGHDIKVG